MDTILKPGFKPTVFFVRHGERSDCVEGEESKHIEIAVDPHLTELGKLQAKHAAYEVLKMTEADKKKPTKYFIVSSPFLRCIQTAFSMIEVFGKENVINNKLYLDNFLGEFLNKIYFTESPMDNLHVSTSPQNVSKYVNIELQNGLFADKEHAFTGTYPETVQELYNRITTGYKKLLKEYESVLQKEGNVVLIMVTHGYGIQSLLDFYDAFDFTKGVEYTCLSQVFYDLKNREGKIGEVQCHSHLEKAENEYKELKRN